MPVSFRQKSRCGSLQLLFTLDVCYLLFVGVGGWGAINVGRGRAADSGDARRAPAVIAQLSLGLAALGQIPLRLLRL